MSDLISRADIPYHKQLEPMGNGQYVEVEVAYKDDIDALQSAEAEDRHYIKIYADDEPSVKAEKLYQICGEMQNREVTEWLKEYFPSAEPKTGRDCTDFVLWLMDEVMDEEMWELNAVANGEVIARKLKKLGLLEVKDGYYIRPSADRASGEWKYLHGSIGSYMTISCPFCGVTFNNVAEWEYNYCPSCGARMKGEEE